MEAGKTVNNTLKLSIMCVVCVMYIVCKNQCVGAQNLYYNYYYLL